MLVTPIESHTKQISLKGHQFSVLFYRAGQFYFATCTKTRTVKAINMLSVTPDSELAQRRQRPTSTLILRAFWIAVIASMSLLTSCDRNATKQTRQPNEPSDQQTFEEVQKSTQTEPQEPKPTINYPERIEQSQLTIYDSLGLTPELLIPTEALQKILRESLQGMLLDMPIRTRSKHVKSAICDAIGYPTPKSFRKTQPRFPGQDFDVYVQKSNNLQIWNEDLSANRRYVLVRVGENLRVTTVRIVTGQQLVKLDTTGTLTRKLQARAIAAVDDSCLVSQTDTPELSAAIQKAKEDNEDNLLSRLMSTNQLYEKLLPLVGTEFENPGNDQERNRGWGLHKAVSKQLGLSAAEDDGQFPDVREQLLELKLQMAGTVDLGLVSPQDESFIAGIENVRNCDVRYGIFYATIVEDKIRLDHVVLTSGADFFNYFQQMQGNVENTKNQIRLPNGFFDE